MGTTDFCRGLGGLAEKLATYLHPAPILRMSGAVPLLPIYAFITWAVTTLTSTSQLNKLYTGGRTEDCNCVGHMELVVVYFNVLSDDLALCFCD